MVGCTIKQSGGGWIPRHLLYKYWITIIGVLTKESIDNYITACLVTLLLGGRLGRSTVLGSTTAHEYAQSTGCRVQANEAFPTKQYCLSRLAVVGLLVRFWCDCHNSKPTVS